MTLTDPRRHSPAAQRNRGPLLDLLRRVLPPSGRVLEIAAGTGEHAVHFAAGLPGWTWLPTDPDVSSLASIDAWAADAALPNLQPALQLDVMQRDWPDGPFDAIFCANMLHIAPWPACAALMRGAAMRLAPAGRLLTYGPYFVAGQAPSQGNADFDADLRSRNTDWGLRYVHEVAAEAAAAGLALEGQHAMPANNLTLVFRRA